MIKYRSVQLSVYKQLRRRVSLIAGLMYQFIKQNISINSCFTDLDLLMEALKKAESIMNEVSTENIKVCWSLFEGLRALNCHQGPLESQNQLLKKLIKQLIYLQFIHWVLYLLQMIYFIYFKTLYHFTIQKI